MQLVHTAALSPPEIRKIIGVARERIIHMVISIIDKIKKLVLDFSLQNSVN